MPLAFELDGVALSRLNFGGPDGGAFPLEGGACVGPALGVGEPIGPEICCLIGALGCAIVCLLRAASKKDSLSSS